MGRSAYREGAAQEAVWLLDYAILTFGKAGWAAPPLTLILSPQVSSPSQPVGKRYLWQ